MSVTSDPSQYADSSNLRKRGNLHVKYAHKSWFGWVRDRLEIAPGDRIADVGCGAGWFWNSVVESLPEIELMLADVSTGMVDEALKLLQDHARIAPLNGVVADIVDLPFEDDRFDHVVAMHMLYHIESIETAVAELKRILRPGGTITVTTNGANNLEEIYRLGSRAFGGSPQDPVLAYFNRDKAETVLGDAFEQVTAHRFEDVYHIDAAVDVFDCLTSFPPGNRASASQIKVLKTDIDARLAQGDGCISTIRECWLVTARKPM